MLKIENLHLRFGGVTAINDVSFSVNQHEILALIGPNGAGKTSVLNCISGFIALKKVIFFLKIMT